MSFKDTCALDYRVVDNTETVTYSATRAGITTVYTVHFADGRDVTWREVNSSDGFLSAGDRVWGLGALEFPAGFRPQRGDVVTQTNGDVWYLKSDFLLDELGIVWEGPSSKAR